MLRIIHGDCLDEMRALVGYGAQVQAIVTDPPYHLTQASRGGSPRSNDPETPFGRTRLGERGFMGKTWDGGDIAMRPETWAAAFALLPPGGHMLVFGGTRTFHRVACAIEDAGFEIRDTLSWLYGSGFCRRGYIRDKQSNIVREGWGGSLKPAWEPIILARKHLAGTVAETVLAHGTGALNIDATRVGKGVLRSTGNGKRNRTDGYGMQGGVIGGSELGRWPANCLHDGSDEVLQAFAAFGDKAGGSFPAARGCGGISTSGHGGQGGLVARSMGDTGTAARFFYSAKASAADRAGSKHPTVKPVSLMRYLVRLITPPGGTVLDPFAGSGTTGEAAMREGFSAVLIEREAEYVEDIERRLDHVGSSMASERASRYSKTE